jgi:hypothetical protein
VLTESAASGATGVLLAKAMGELRKVVQQNPGDKDLATAVDTMDKVLDAKSFVDSPVNFAAGKIKEKLIQGVFDHFSASLNTAYQSFNEKFPSVATLHKDPLGTGVSLEGYQQNYEKALAALRIPDARKTLLYAAALIGLDPDTQGEEIERRIGLVNQALAGLPGLSEYIKAYSYARDQYNFALGAVTNQLGLLDDEWAKQPAGLADGLRRRADALYGVAKVLEDAHDQLWNSGLVIWVPILGAAQDLETLAHGFGGLAEPLSDFANVVGSRKGQYDKEFDRLHAEGIKVGAQAVRPF